jgi:hypothetical protein
MATMVRPKPGGVFTPPFFMARCLLSHSLKGIDQPIGGGIMGFYLFIVL